MQLLKQSTQVDVRIGPFVDVTDGFTPETGVDLSTADEAELLKHNGAATSSLAAATFAAIAGCDGWYDLTLTTDHTDTLGLLDVVVQDDSVCLPVHARFMVVPANVYDCLIGGTDNLKVDAVEISSDSTAADDLELFIEALGTDDKVLVSTDAQDLSGTLDVNTKTITNGAITAAAIATDAIDADALAADALAEINAEVVDVIRTDTATELAAVPAASPALHTMVQFIFMKLRNKEILDSGAGTHTISNDAGATIATSSVTDAAGVATKGEYA